MKIDEDLRCKTLKDERIAQMGTSFIIFLYLKQLAAQLS